MNDKGITLIALVITIIVLLILAGVSISFVSGDNGIIKKSQAAKLNTEQANIVEQLQLIISEKMMEIKSELENENDFSDYKLYIDYLIEKGIIKDTKIVNGGNLGQENQKPLVQAGQGTLQELEQGLETVSPSDEKVKSKSQINNEMDSGLIDFVIVYYIIDVNKLVENAQTGKGDLESGDVYYILNGNLFYLSENKECILLQELFEIEIQDVGSILG